MADRTDTPVPMTADECEQIFHAALTAGDIPTVEAALRVMVARDPARAVALYDMLRVAVAVADAVTR